MNRLCLRILAALALASPPTGAAVSAEFAAQDYPAKPIRLIVSFPAGSSDVLGRAFAQYATLGQPVVVENVSGANGAIGMTRLAKSAPDGYTIAVGATTNLAVSPHLNSHLPYDPLKDFAPIALLARVPIVMVVNAAVPATSVAEFVALARAHPGKLNYGSIGNGSTGHLLGEMLRRLAGIDIVHVPYKGASPGVNALLAGDVQNIYLLGEKDVMIGRDVLNLTIPTFQSEATALTIAQGVRLLNALDHTTNVFAYSQRGEVWGMVNNLTALSKPRICLLGNQNATLAFTGTILSTVHSLH